MTLSEQNRASIRAALIIAAGRGQASVEQLTDELCKTLDAARAEGAPAGEVGEKARRIIEKIADAVTTMRREVAGSAFDQIEEIARECVPLFEQLGMSNEGDGWGFDDDEPSLPASEVEVGENQVGAAEAQVGRYIYRRVERLMDAKSGTPESAELDYLANIVVHVEEYGEEACADNAIGVVPAPAGEVARVPPDLTVTTIVHRVWDAAYDRGRFGAASQMGEYADVVSKAANEILTLSHTPAPAGEGGPAGRRRLTEWAKAAIRFVDRCSADPIDYADNGLSDDADVLLLEGFGFFGLTEDNCIADLEYGHLVALSPLLASEARAILKDCLGELFNLHFNAAGPRTFAAIEQLERLAAALSPPAAADEPVAWLLTWDDGGLLAPRHDLIFHNPNAATAKHRAEQLRGLSWVTSVELTPLGPVQIPQALQPILGETDDH